MSEISTKFDNNHQKLIDIMFEVALTIRTSPALKRMSNEKLAEWVAKQLRGCDFPTQPIGSSWGVLESRFKEKE